MNKQPIVYMQTDPQWAKMRYPCNNGTMSIGGGGCGETCAAMLISTLTGKVVLPTETMDWACKRGYVTANQGTDYSYFYPQFKKYNIDAGILTWAACLSPTSPVRGSVIKRLKEGFYFIALMKKGLWTNGGHYVVVWWAGDKIEINDPASTKPERWHGDPDTFFSQAKYFWWVDARDYNKEDENMDVSMLTNEQCYEILLKANEYAAGLATPEWMRDELKEAVDAGITDGSRPLATCMRGQAAIMAMRAVKKK